MPGMSSSVKVILTLVGLALAVTLVTIGVILISAALSTS